MNKIKSENTPRKWAKIVLIACLVLTSLILVSLVAIVSVSEYVRLSTSDSIFTSAEEIGDLSDVDCIIVLGAGLKSDGTPSHMLEDRIKVGVEVMKHTGIKYILMSGDCSGKYYDEPAAMKEYAQSLGIEAENILIDGKGYSTLESIERAKEEYGFERVIIITQKYHLHRALYISDRIGLNAIGVSSDLRGYSGQTMREMREILARIKDFIFTI